MEKISKVSFYEEIEKNKKKSTILLVFFIIITVSALIALNIPVYLFIGLDAALLIFLIGLFIIIAHAYRAYRNGYASLLKAVRAKPADPKKNRHLINTAEGLAIAAGIPVPSIYVIESVGINAFAVGMEPEKAVVTFTTGALNHLNRSEIEGVMGHEIAHIANYDTRYATLVGALVGIIAIMSHVYLRGSLEGGASAATDETAAFIFAMIVIAAMVAIFAPLATRIVQKTISRKREFLADATGSKLTRYPEGLASALEKIKKINKGKMSVSEGMSHIFFTDPTHGPLDWLLATHTPLDERIAVLKSM